MEQFLIVFSTAFLLPVSIVFLVSMRKRNSDNKRAEILMKALETGSDLDADKLAEALQTKGRSEKDVLYARLQRGCIYTFVGLALLIIYFINPFSGNDNDLWMPLTLGLVSMALGAAYLTVYFVTRKSVDEKQ